jgi:UDP-glucose 4-epimerase
MRNPGKYFGNNVQGLVQLLDVMVDHQVASIIFSSTAAVYGNPKTVPIPENHDKNPESPYGESKLMAEKILSWYQKTKNINYVALRYFNACGASLDASIGEQHNPETHLIPNALVAAVQGTEFTLYGDDYDTPDGSCIRDYIHVLDLARAHMAGLEKLQKNPGGYAYNVGTGKGYSNREVIEMVKKVTNKDIKITTADRRPGDPAVLIAQIDAIKNELQFLPEHSDLETIVSTAYAWLNKNNELQK